MASAEEVQQRVNLQGTADSSKYSILIGPAIFLIPDLSLVTILSNQLKVLKRNDPKIEKILDSATQERIKNKFLLAIKNLNSDWFTKNPYKGGIVSLGYEKWEMGKARGWRNFICLQVCFVGFVLFNFWCKVIFTGPATLFIHSVKMKILVAQSRQNTVSQLWTGYP